MFILIVLMWDTLGLTYNLVFLVARFDCRARCSVCSPTVRIHASAQEMVYVNATGSTALQFMSGARRQIFMVLPGSRSKNSASKCHLTGLYLINLVINMFARFWARQWVLRDAARYLRIYRPVRCVPAYAGIYWFSWGVLLAAILYVIDHILFGYTGAGNFQKIADPADIAPTAAVAFTINHIAAVFLPVLLGLLWIVSPGAVFFCAAGMAGTPALALLIAPSGAGKETLLSRLSQPG